MEDTLRDLRKFRQSNVYLVLILVLMEDTLRVSTQTGFYNGICLNPCFNGRYSQRLLSFVMMRMLHCLNPCFNGRYSQSIHIVALFGIALSVLILVLMEDTLRGLPKEEKDTLYMS